MSELRKDVLTGRWVIISPERANRPNAFAEYEIQNDSSEDCPFCPGHEERTPPELLTLKPDPRKKEWGVRVVSNRYPALRIEGEVKSRSEGLFDKMEGIGAHEVVIETPEHDIDQAELSLKQTAGIFMAHAQRMTDLFRDKRFAYILAFKNRGAAAGATISHPHSQLIALPIVPITIERELSGAKKYFDYRGRCFFCDTVEQEREDQKRLVSLNQHFIAYTPFASRFPFEIRISPLKHRSFFWEISREETNSLAEIQRDVLRRYKLALKNPPFSSIIHTTPPNHLHPEHYHWHVEMMPKLTAQGGFEWGSGFYINPMSPEEAARYLRHLDDYMDVPKNYLLPTTGSVNHGY